MAQRVSCIHLTVKHYTNPVSIVNCGIVLLVHVIVSILYSMPHKDLYSHYPLYDKLLQ